MMMNFYYFAVALACLQVNSRKCYTCNGVGKTEDENSVGNFFDLSHREEALTAERDESTIDVDLCNNIKGALPERMLQICANVDDVCFVEKVYGRLEAAMEMSDGEEDMRKVFELRNHVFGSETSFWVETLVFESKHTFLSRETRF